MTKDVFVGRKRELERLQLLHKKITPNLVVIKGRRRVGKTYLINHFASLYPNNKLWDFAGVTPQKDMDAQSQRDNFGRQLSAHLKKNEPLTFSDWFDAFEYLNKHIQSKDIILFDEISCMGHKDPTFIPKFKLWWDKQKMPIMAVICGSSSTWIEENILKSTALFGRINQTMSLKPLSIQDSNRLITALSFKGSDYDKYKLLSVLGGIPWYLHQITPGQTADSLIKQLCFDDDGTLIYEFDRIFYDVFNGKGGSYKKILDSLKNGMKTLSEIRTSTGFAHSGTLSTLMEHLITAGFVAKQPLWSFKAKKVLKQSLYRIFDPYMRFYLKVIEPKLSLTDQKSPVSIYTGFDTHMGLQLEQFLLQNKEELIDSIGINSADVIASGPFRQFKSKAKAGCQIDLLIQTATKNLFVCEFKFKQRELGVDILKEVQNKVSALKAPKGFAVIPVLFHIGGVSSNVAASEYFYRIIDIADLLDY